MLNPVKWVCIGAALFLSLILPVLALAEAPDAAASGDPLTAGETTEKVAVEATEEVTAEGEESQETDTAFDRHKRFVDTKVLHASQWIDGFFADPSYEEESANSQFRIRPELYYQDQQGTKLKMRVHAKIPLPNLGHRISLVAGADENDDQTGDFADDRNQSRIAGLQFFISDTAKWNTTIALGAKFNEFAFFLGPRFRYQTDLNDKTLVRLTQFVRWQTNNYWDIGSRGDLYYVLNEDLYFRQTLFARWRGEHSDQEGVRTLVSSVLSQRLSSTAGLQYEFSTVFHTRPDTHVDKYVASLRFRKQTHREWLYYEIVPQLAFEDEFDFKTNPGIRLRLEIFYGSYRSRSAAKEEPDDSEDFRW